jgi:hypothetical protein
MVECGQSIVGAAMTLTMSAATFIVAAADIGNVDAQLVDTGGFLFVKHLYGALLWTFLSVFSPFTVPWLSG